MNPTINLYIAIPTQVDPADIAAREAATAGFVIETPGRIDALGFAPITSGSLPPILERMVRPHCEVQLLTLEAGLLGDRELAIEALLADPLCAHVKPSDVRQMGQELLDANSELLPQFQ